VSHDILVARATLVAAVYPLLTDRTCRKLTPQELDHLLKIVNQLAEVVSGPPEIL
jgi:hypothetical protein